MTIANPAGPIWFHPPRFWAVTKEMSQEEADRLLNEVIALAEIRDLDALRRFPFVSVEPYEPRARVSETAQLVHR